MEGHCSTSQSPQWWVVPMEEEEEEEEVEEVGFIVRTGVNENKRKLMIIINSDSNICLMFDIPKCLTHI